MNGWLIAWGLAMSAVAIATSLVAWLKYKSERTITKQLKQTRLRLDALTHAHQTTKDQRDRLNEENEDLHKSIGAQAKQSLDLHKKNTELHAQLADRNEALQEAQAAVKLREAEKADLWFKIAQLEDEESARRASEVNATVPLQEMPPALTDVAIDKPMAYAETKDAIEKAAQTTPRRTRHGKITGEP